MRRRTNCHLDSKPAWPRTGFTRALASTVLTLMMAACSDPGSGGSGIPSGASTSAPITTPNTSPQVGNPNPVMLATQTVDALETDAVTIGGLRYLATQLEIVFADGSSAPFAAFKVGQSVLIGQTLSSSPTLTWKVTIQAP